MTIIFWNKNTLLLQKLIKINGYLLFLPSRSVSRSQRLSLAILGDSFLRSPHEATSFEGAPLGQRVALVGRTNDCFLLRFGNPPCRGRGLRVRFKVKGERWKLKGERLEVRGGAAKPHIHCLSPLASSLITQIANGDYTSFLRSIAKM